MEYVNSNEKLTDAGCMEIYFLTAELKSCLHDVKVVPKFCVMEVEPNSSSRQVEYIMNEKVLCHNILGRSLHFGRPFLHSTHKYYVERSQEAVN